MKLINSFLQINIINRNETEGYLVMNVLLPKRRIEIEFFKSKLERSQNYFLDRLDFSVYCKQEIKITKCKSRKILQKLLNLIYAKVQDETIQ